MTGTQYRATRKALNLTQVQLAKRLDVSPKTIKNREKADSISVEAELAIRALNA